MKDEIPLPRNIVENIPKGRRKNTISNLKWVFRNVILDEDNQKELEKLIKEKENDG